MSKRENSKHKIDRRLGVNLWGRPKSPLNKRQYGPGQHGQRRKKPTDFGTQLMAKQKLKGYYGSIGERQFRRYYQEASRRKRVNIASYQVKEGDEIQIRAKSRDLPLVLGAIDSSEREVPDYVEVNIGERKARFIRAPKLADVPYPVQMEPNLVVEFYSR